jgi:hypothetical protein
MCFLLVSREDEEKQDHQENQDLQDHLWVNNRMTVPFRDCLFYFCILLTDYFTLLWMMSFFALYRMTGFSTWTTSLYSLYPSTTTYHYITTAKLRNKGDCYLPTHLIHLFTMWAWTSVLPAWASPKQVSNRWILFWVYLNSISSNS